MKPKGVTTHMKALNECFLMGVFSMLLNILQILCLIWTEKQGIERIKG